MPITRRSLLPLPLLLLAPGVVGGCNTAAIKRAYMAKDSAGRMRTDTFKTEGSEIHLIVEFVSGREDAILRVGLTPKSSALAFDVTEYAPGQGESRIDIKLFVESSTNQRLFKGPWPVGEYDALLHIDDELEKSVGFAVAG